MAFDPGAGGLLGTNDLQQTVDRFTDAVSRLTSTVSNMSTSMSNGMTRSPSHSASAEGAMFSSQPGMGAVPAAFTTLAASQARGAAIIGSGSGQGAPTLNRMSAGGGANGGGANGLASLPQGALPSGGTGAPGGPLMQNGNFYNGQGIIGGGGAGGGGTGGVSPGGGFSFAQSAVQAAGSFTGWAQSTGMSRLSNQQLFNAYGSQMQAQWGGSAQTYQNQAFGNGINGAQNNAAAGNAQSAAGEFGTLTQIAGGANVTSTAAFGATNALAFSNQGLGAAGAAQAAGQIYNPQSSFRMQMLTGVSAFGSNGQQNSLSSIIGGLAGQGYIGGGGYNSKTGTFSKTALNASFAAGRGTSWMNLQSLGYSQAQIQDIQSTISEANNAALKGGTSMQNVLNTENKAEYGQSGQTNNANSQLAKWGVSLSTVQKQGNAASQNMSQQQSESSTFNDSVSAFTSSMQKATSAVNWFLDKSGLNKAVGAVQGAGAGYSSSGAQNWVNGIGNAISSLASIGGGAAAVSVTQPMTVQGSRAGSSMSGASGQVQTAVKDAEAQVGKPYVYGGSSPATSFDCSGLVMWAYEQAGVTLPRTSQAQWAALASKSVSLGQVREGDIVFSAGSDGTAQAPGHEALMISDNQIVEAPSTGVNIRIRSFNPGEWQHAARPAGGTGGTAAGGGTASVSGTQTGASAGSQFAGNAGGTGSGGDSSLGLTTDADAMLFSGSNGAGLLAAGMSASGNGGSSSSSTSNAGLLTGATGGTLTPAQIQKLWTSLGGPAAAAGNMARVAMAESGDRAGTKQQSQPASLTGWGLYQITPTSGIRQNGEFGDLLNASNNTRAAISLFQKSGYSPWSSDPVGASLTGMATGGPIVVGERGPELFVPETSGNVMTAAQTSSLLRGTSAQPAQAPWTSTSARQLLLDTLSPANATSRAGGGGGVNVTVQVAANAISMSGSGGGVAADAYTAGQQFSLAVTRSLEASTLLQNLAKGVTG